MTETNPRKRPKHTEGLSVKVPTGCGNLYVILGYVPKTEPKELIELFAKLGYAGGCQSGWTEAVGRLVSLALRYGASVKDIVKQLQGIQCPTPSWCDGTQIKSCPDAIAWVLRTYDLKEEADVQTGT